MNPISFGDYFCQSKKILRRSPGLPGSGMDLRKSKGMKFRDSWPTPKGCLSKGILSQRDPFGADWQKLSKATIALQRYKGLPPKESFGLGKGEIGDENNPLLAAIGFNLRSKYNQIAEKVQHWLQTILHILKIDMAWGKHKNQNFGYQTLKVTF